MVSIFWFLFSNTYGGDAQRHITLAFALFLAIFLHEGKLSQPSSTKRLDLFIATLAAGCALYPWVFQTYLYDHLGAPNWPSWAVTIITGFGLSLLLLAIWRVFNAVVILIVLLVIVYSFFGGFEWVPQSIQWKGASAGKVLWHYWVGSNAVFGLYFGALFPLIIVWMICSVFYFFVDAKCQWTFFGSRRITIDLLAIVGFVGFLGFLKMGFASRSDLAMFCILVIFSHLVYSFIRRTHQEHPAEVFESWLSFVALIISPIVQWALFAAMVGVVIGTVTLTGFHQVFFELKDWFVSAYPALSGEFFTALLAVMIGWMLWVLFCSARAKVVIDGQVTNHIGFVFVISQLFHKLF